ncbi:hypothetical protein ACFVZT_11680 [Streptomyces sp. NPDC058321]|uniref:hypothetical protein n=1 Tax=Streptomyces sp. NPDC058321 TaxID=3346445 RepID=UPI0036EAAEAA
MAENCRQFRLQKLLNRERETVMVRAALRAPNTHPAISGGMSVLAMMSRREHRWRITQAHCHPGRSAADIRSCGAAPESVPLEG